MRAVAAISIVVYHVWLGAAPGAVSVDLGPFNKIFVNLLTGVTLFFVLSGFLLFRPYVASALRNRPSPSLRAYLRNRALRILPAYWVILLAVAVFFHRELLSVPQQLAANVFFLQNYIPSYMPHLNGGVGIVPAWSLAIEVVFYLMVPILGGAAIHLARRSGLGPVTASLVPVLFMASLGIGAKALGRLLELGEVWELTLFTHADWFAAGMALAVVRVRWEDGAVRFGRRSGYAAAVGAAAFALVGTALYTSGTLDILEYQTPMAVACALLLGLVVFAGPGSRLVALLSTRPVFAAGLGSYSLFLWHDPLLRFFRDAGLTASGRPGFLLNLALIGLVAGVASGLTYRFVEKPALARKRTWQQGDATAPSPRPSGTPEPAELRPTPTTPLVAK